MHKFSVKLSRPAEHYLSEIRKYGLDHKGDSETGVISGMGVTAHYIIKEQSASIELSKSMFNPIPFKMIEDEIRKVFSE